MRFLCFALSIVMSFLTSSVSAQDSLCGSGEPFMEGARSLDGGDTLDVTCIATPEGIPNGWKYGDDRRKITEVECEFTQHFIRHLDAPGEFYFPLNISKEIKSGDTSRILEFCTAMSPLLEKASTRELKSPKVAKAYRTLSKGCTAKDTKLVLEGANQLVYIRSKSCSIGTNRFSIKFKRVPSIDQWIADTAPKGGCLITSVDQFICKAGKWEYTSERVGVGDTGPLCIHLTEGIGKKLSWSNLNLETDLDCEFWS